MIKELTTYIKLANRDIDFLPARATDNSAGYDVYANISIPINIYPGETEVIPLGFSTALPTGTAALLLPRSGLGAMYGMILANCMGLIDSDYRDEWKAVIWNRNNEDMVTVNPKMRIAQFILINYLNTDFIITPDLNETTRFGGFSSTGEY